ncbi:MAG: hypothetical protein ACRET0_00525 [Steroidobacteraceae bacterium]
METLPGTGSRYTSDSKHCKVVRSPDVTSQLHSVGVAAIVVALLILIFSKRSAAERWKRLFRALRSPLIESPRFRALFLVVTVGILLVSLVPEAAVLIAAVDTLGLDIVTIMVAVELGRYLTAISRSLGVSAIASECRRQAGRILGCRAFVLSARPALWPYACLSLLVALYTLIRGAPRS